MSIVWIIECWSVFLRAFVVQSIQQFPRELICISRISLLANSDVSTRALFPLSGRMTAVCGRGSKVTDSDVEVMEDAGRCSQLKLLALN